MVVTFATFVTFAASLATLFVNHDLTKIQVSNPVILNCVLIGGLLLATLLTIRKGQQDTVLSIEQSQQIRGIAILLVILNHLSHHTIAHPEDLPLFQDAGYLGVNLFLILSGYGIAISLARKGTKNFWLRRLVRLFVPIVLAMLLEILLNYGLNLAPVKSLAIGAYQMFFDLQKLDRNLWFIPFLLFWYCAVYLIFHTTFSEKFKHLFLFSLPFLFLPTLSSSFAWKMSAFAFPFGYWLGNQSDWLVSKLQQLKQQSTLKLTAMLLALLLLTVLLHSNLRLLRQAVQQSSLVELGLALLGLVVLGWVVRRSVRRLWQMGQSAFFKPQPSANSVALVLTAMIVIFNYNGALGWEPLGKLLYSITHNLAGISLFAAMTVGCCLLSQHKLRSRFLSFLGELSFELYLLHGMFMYSFDFILFRGELALTFFIYLLVLCLASWILQSLGSRLASRLLDKLEAKPSSKIAAP